MKIGDASLILERAHAEAATAWQSLENEFRAGHCIKN